MTEDIMTKKEKFAVKVVDLATTLGVIADQLPDLYKAYFDKGYNSGGDDPIEDADLANLEITSVQLTDALTMLNNLNKFFTNEAPTTGDYVASINALRW